MNFFTKVFKESIPFSQYKQQRLGLYNPPTMQQGTNTPYQPLYQQPTLQPGQTREQLIAQALAAHNAQTIPTQAAGMAPAAPVAPPAPSMGAPVPGGQPPGVTAAPAPQMTTPRDPRLMAAYLRQ